MDAATSPQHQCCCRSPVLGSNWSPVLLRTFTACVHNLHHTTSTLQALQYYTWSLAQPADEGRKSQHPVLLQSEASEQCNSNISEHKPTRPCLGHDLMNHRWLCTNPGDPDNWVSVGKSVHDSEAYSSLTLYYLKFGPAS
jgi:hypothetical protein